jgi:hypothetical protein
MGVDALVKKILKEIGIREERFNLQWASAAEAPRFVKLITDFTKQIKDLGPLGHAEGLKPEEVRERIAKALELVSSQKLRVGFGNVAKTLRKEGSRVTKETIAETVDAKLTKTISSSLS